MAWKKQATISAALTTPTATAQPLMLMASGVTLVTETSTKECKRRMRLTQLSLWDSFGGCLTLALFVYLLASNLLLP